MLHLYRLTVFVFREKKYKTKYKMECIIHYFGLKSYSKLKPVSSINEEAILKTKSIRESTGGQNQHQQQCNSIPTTIDKEKHQGMLLEIHTSQQQEPHGKEWNKRVFLIISRKTQ